MERSKLLATFAVLAMVLAVFAMIPLGDVDAADTSKPWEKDAWETTKYGGSLDVGVDYDVGSKMLITHIPHP